MSLLVVDDSRDQVLLLSSILRKAALGDVVCFPNAVEALDHLESPEGRAVELILMDMMMPELDGIAACRRIRKMRDIDDVPIIIITARDSPKDLESAFDAGATDFIAKPVNRIELLARVRAALRLKHETDLRKSRELSLTAMAIRLKEANEHLSRLSRIDALTGIPNRRYFDEALERFWRGAMRGHSPLALLMIDVDFFKSYNDSYGHQAGDHCLCRIASSLRANLKRADDVVARYGGEEFAVLLPDTDPGGAATVAERLRAAVHQQFIRRPGSTSCDRVTISVGVGSLTPDLKSPADLIAVADRRMYRAKNLGRNQVVHADAELPATESADLQALALQITP